MDKFLFRAIIFGFLLSIVILLVDIFKLYTLVLPSKGIYHAIERSRNIKRNARILLLGDSAAAQLFQILNDKDSISSLACNQAVDFIGHFLLLNDFLANNPTIEKIIFVTNPFSFSNDLNHIYTYNYFIKPFYKKYYLSHFTNYAKAQIEKIPFSGIANNPFIRFNFWSPKFERLVDENIFLSRISRDYLVKMLTLAKEKGVKFEILSPPLKETRKKEVDNLYKIYLTQRSSDIDILDAYFKSIKFVEYSYFQDHVHYKNEAIPYVRDLFFQEFIFKK